MEIAVILVNMFEGRHHDAMQPILFAILDALSPGHRLLFYDERIAPLPETIDADLVALSVDTFSAARGYALSDRFRQAGKTVVMGGIHPTSAPEEAQEHADAIIVGEAEDTWPQLLADYESGQLKKQYRSNQPPLMGFDSNHPAIRKGYLPLGLMETSRGCPYRCDFCSVKVLYPGAVRRKALDVVESEIANSPHRLLFFTDDNLFSDRDYFVALMQILAKHKKRWAAQVSVDLAEDGALLAAAKKSGCVILLMGFESLHEDSLKNIGKQKNRRTDLRTVTKRVHAHGILLYATFVFGYDDDTSERVHEVEEFAKRLGITVVNFNPLQPMPGTALYRRLLADERLLREAWWLDESYRYGQMAFEPKGVRAKPLAEAIAQARKRFYSPTSGLCRWLRNPAIKSPVLTGIHFMLNRVSRKEIARKEGRHFHASHTD